MLIFFCSSAPTPALSTDPPPPHPVIATVAAADVNGKSRRLRLSVGGFLPPNLFKPTGTSAGISSASQSNSVNKRNGAKKPTKLVRTTRSTSELRNAANSTSGASRVNKASVTSRDALGYATDDSSQNGHSTLGGLLKADGDILSALLGWSEQDATSASSSSRRSVDEPSTPGSGEDEFLYRPMGARPKTK